MDGTPEQVCRAGRGSCRGHGRAPSAPLGAIVIALQVRRATAQKQYLKYFFWNLQGATPAAAEAGSGRRCRQVEELAQLALGPDEVRQGVEIGRGSGREKVSDNVWCSGVADTKK